MPPEVAAREVAIEKRTRSGFRGSVAKHYEKLRKVGTIVPLRRRRFERNSASARPQLDYMSSRVVARVVPAKGRVTRNNDESAPKRSSLGESRPAASRTKEVASEESL